MTSSVRVILAVLVMALGAGAVAPSPAPAPLKLPPALAVLPKETVGFIHVPKISGLEADLKRLAKESGLAIGKGDHPIMDFLAGRTGIKAGLDPDGDAAIGFVDPKTYRDRYTIYVVPVADWDALLKATPNEPLAAGQYALTSASGPRFVARRGKYAVVTSSVRTMDAVAGAESLAAGLPPETVALAAGEGPMFYVDVHRLSTIYQDDIIQWFKAASGQVYDTPDAAAYADMLSTYMLGMADFIDQIEAVGGAVTFGPDGVGLDLQVRFVEGASVAKFMSTQVPGTAALPMPAGRPLVSAFTLRTDPKTRTDLMLAATRFFLDKAPRPQPLAEGTKDQVNEAMQTFAGSLGPDITFLSAPAEKGKGLSADVTVFDLKDPEQFRKGLSMMVASWEALADQLGLYMKFETSPDKAEIDGVPLTLYVPKFRFGVAARQDEFRQRLQTQYGPEGLVYRVAVVGNKALVASGSDLSLLADTISHLKKGEAAPVPPALERLRTHLPAGSQGTLAFSMPMYVAQSLLRGGTPADRIGTPDPGKEIAGLTLTAVGATVRVSSWFPHEQIRLAMDLLKHAAPDIAETPKSLFQPSTEGPPAPAKTGG